MQSKICPYPGLRPFNEEESIFFKGREEQVQRIVKRLGEKKFLMINGASGDGKSSLMYAGVIPYAKAGFFKAPFDKWLVVNFRPERKPLSNLTDAVCTELQLTEKIKVEKELGYGFSALIDFYKASSYYFDEEAESWKQQSEEKKNEQKRKAANLLILVDQFEEFFTNSDNFPAGVPSQESIKVVNLILESYKIAIAQNLPVYVVCTMRSDYIGQCATFRGLPEAIGYSQFFVPRLKRQELEQVIEGSAQLSGGAVNKSLVQYLLNHAGEGFDQLPILQHALNKVWAMAGDGEQELSKIHLAKVGGIPVQSLNTKEKTEFDEWFNRLPHYKKKLFEKPSLNNVLNAHANELLEILPDYYYSTTQKKLSKEAIEHIVKVAFQCLTVIDKGIAVRRITNLSEITTILNDKNIQESDVDAVLRIFRLQGNTLLEPFVIEDHKNIYLKSDTVIDITHESLIRNWDVLSEWANEEFENYNTWLDLEKQLKRWQASNESESYLLGQGPLSYFYDWNDKFNPNKFWLSTYDESQRTYAEKLAVAEQKVEALNRFLMQSRRAIRQKRNFAISLTAAAFVVLGLFTFWSLIERQKAVAQEKVANQKTREAEKSKEAALANKRIAEWQEKKALELGGIAEIEKDKALNAKDAAERAKREALLAKAIAEQEKIRAEQQSLIATQEAQKAETQSRIADDAKNKAITAEQKARQLTLASLTQNLAFKSTQVENDNELQGLLALQAYNFTLQNKQNVQDPVIYEALRAYCTKYQHPKGIVNGRTTETKRFYREPRSLALSKRNNQIICAANDDSLSIFSNDLSFISKTPVPIINGKNNRIKNITLLSPDAKRILCGFNSGEVLLSAIPYETSEEKKSQIISTKQQLRCAAFNSSGSLLAYSNQDSSILFGNFNKNEYVEEGSFKADALVTALAIADDGSTLFYGNTKGELIKYEIKTRKSVTLYKAQSGYVLALALASKNNILAIGLTTGKLIVIELTNSNFTSLLDLRNIPIENLTFNPSATLLAGSIADKSIRVFDISNLTANPIVLKNQNEKANCLLFLDDSRLVAGVSVSRIIWDWQLSSEKLAETICQSLTRNITKPEWEKYVGKEIDYQKTCENLKDIK